MSLVKCPECGKGNVSDSAIACPDCGFGIKEYFEKIERERLQEEKREQLDKAKTEAEKKRLESQKQEKEHTIKYIENQIESERKTRIICSILAVVGGIIGTVAFIYSEHGSLGFFIILGYGVAAFCIAGLVMTAGSIEEMENNLRIARTDFDKYQKDIENWYKAEALRKQMEEANKIECPYCHSKDTVKISKVSKAVSAAMVGALATGKVSKQWHCNHCKSEF